MGKFLYETHMHTSQGSGCGRNSGAEQARAYKKRGYQGIIITDHFINGYSTCPKNSNFSWTEKMKYVVAGYLAAKTEGDKIGLDVFLGWEFTIRGSDFLTYGLDWDFLIDNPNFDKLEIDKYSALVRENNGFLAQAHPFRDRPYIQHKYPVDPEHVDAVEIFNASDPDKTNKKARDYAKLHNLPVQAGSDSHGIDNGFSSGIILDHRAEDIHDIISAIKCKKVELILP